jgi:predicted O-methyltransferase YrrM
MPMEIIHHKAEKYALTYTSPLDLLLAENEEKTLLNHPHAQMHSGHVQGKVLEMLSLMIKPLKILEIGTFTGFSALCLAKGLQTGGMLHTIELREEDANTADGYFKRSDHKDQIKLHIGDAREVLKELKEPWDLVFIDADKTGYIDYYELTLPFLKKGAWLIADNVLFHGQVLEDEVTGKNAKAIHAFNEHIAKDNRVEHVMLTVRDGLLVIRKL